MSREAEIQRDVEIQKVTKVLEEIGLKFARSVAVQLVDRKVGTDTRFEIADNQTTMATSTKIILPKDYNAKERCL